MYVHCRWFRWFETLRSKMLQSWGKTSAILRHLSAKKRIDSAPEAHFPATIRECKACAAKLGKTRMEYWNISKTYQKWIKSVDSRILTQRQIFSQLPIILYLWYKTSRWRDSHKEHYNTLASALKHNKELCAKEEENMYGWNAKGCS